MTENSAHQHHHHSGHGDPADMPKPLREERRAPIEEITELAPGVRRLQLPINFTGLGHVNCYILDDDKGAALIDPGLPGREAWKSLQAGLTRAGLKVGDIHTVLVTHSHPDHFGQAGRLRKEAGARVITHRDFRMFWDPSEDDDEPLENVDTPDDNVHLVDEAGKTPWGAELRFETPRHRRLMYALMRTKLGRVFIPTPNPTHRVEDGNVIELAGREFRAVHTPGHTIDHLCLHDPEHKLLFAGDHVLPTITPHISGLKQGRDPLRAFFGSLDKVASYADVERVLPAHGLEFQDIGSRVRHIKDHHNERLDILREASADLGPATVEQYMKRLFQKRSWGPMAESETFAHLEHLRYDGEASISRREDGQLLYTFT
ncbi:MAG: MBL fold metallo-hydrolase [Acidimicrobiales bacterium]|nr:MBL fold metallo-hydrolase [Acidimicrobiales bacterium]